MKQVRVPNCVSSSGSLFVTLLLLTGLCLLLPVSTRAQRSTASINGTVKDTTGAVMPEATVILTNTGTGLTQTATTNGAGDYIILNILPGKYTLKASKQGFETATQAEFTLYVNQTATFDFSLPVGSAMQTVTVEATAAHIEGSTAELGTVQTEREVNNLPLNGRNFTQLLELTPGVSPVSVAQNSGGWTAQPLGAFTFPSVNGQTNRSNFFMMDGINNQGSFESTYAIAPVIDDIQEFKVQSHNDEAQFGGALGAIVNTVTKGGTNSFHGAGFEFLRNNVLDARGFFIPPAQKTTPYKQNQFGGTVGGPLVIPHVYDGHNKTFFYLSYEGFRNHTSASTLYRVPTPAELSGDLSDFKDNSGNLIQVYNPFSTRPDPNNPGKLLRDPFPNNQIPSNLISPNMVNYAKTIFPAPINTGNPAYNGLDLTPNIWRQDQASARFDRQISSKDQFFIRYTGLTQPFKGSGGFEGYVGEVFFHGYNAAANWVHTFAGSAVAQFTFGRNSMQYNNPTEFTNVPASFAISSGFSPNFVSNFIGGITLIPSLSITGANFPSGGDGISNSHTSDVTEFKGDFSKLWGRHTFKMGADFNTNNFDAVYENNNVGFAAFETSNLVNSTGGVALASFLMDVPDNAGRRNVHETEYSGWVDGFYFQDQWRATDKLTVNLGFRYDVTFIPAYGSNADKNNMVGSINFNSGTYIIQKNAPACGNGVVAPCIPGGTLPANVVVSSNGKVYHNTYDNWQPRIGLAYRLRPATVLRASYGRFFDNWAAVTQTAQNYEGTWPDIGQLLANSLNSATPTTSALNPFGVGLIPAPTPFQQVQWYMDPLAQNPYSDQWNLGVQQQLGGNTVLSANYVGSHSSRLDIGGYYNVALTPGPGNAAQVTARQPFPYIGPTYYDRSWGRGSYNAFQFSLDKKSASGLAYLVSYTWSKTMDLGSDGWYGVEGFSVQDPYHFNRDKSVAGFDLTHILSFSWVYPLPFGRGQRWSSNNRALNYTFGNWQFNGIMFLASGQPYSIFANGDIANTGNANGYERASAVSGVPLYPSQKTPNQWFNAGAFAAPAPYTFGSLGRNSLRADWSRNFDLSLFRAFPVTESKRLEFRAEFFNTFNTPTFGIPDSTVGDQHFGEVFSTSNAARIIQLALKFYF